VLKRFGEKIELDPLCLSKKDDGISPSIERTFSIKHFIGEISEVSLLPNSKRSEKQTLVKALCDKMED